MADVNVFLILAQVINIKPGMYFTRHFCVAKSYNAGLLQFLWSTVIFETDISRGSVATCLRCGGIFTYACFTN